MEPVGFVVGIIVGTLSCFFGHRAIKVILGLWGFAVGAAAVAYVVHSFAGNDLVLLGGAFLGGLAGAALFVFLFRAGIFMLGAGLGALVASLVTGGASGEPHLGAVLGVAVVGGVAALVLQKPIVIVSTAFMGAASIATGLLYFLGDHAPDEIAENPAVLGNVAYAALAVWIVLGMVGCVVQYGALRSDSDAPPAD